MTTELAGTKEGERPRNWANYRLSLLVNPCMYEAHDGGKNHDCPITCSRSSNGDWGRVFKFSFPQKLKSNTRKITLTKFEVLSM